jgi:hypothetical protein
MPLRSERRFISYGKVTSGMLLEFSYKGKNSTQKTYTVLVIDPSRQNTHATEYQLHALLIDDLSDFDLLGLITKVGNLSLDPANRAAPLTDLKSNDAYTIYTNSIASQRRYRTFTVDKLSAVRQILIGELE